MMAELLNQLRNEIEGTIEADALLSGYTTWKVGGKADLLIEPRNAEAVERALTILRRTGVPWLVIGGGSNLLIKDDGFRGAVITTRKLRAIEIAADGHVQVESGASLAEVVKKSIKAGLAGLERLAGIPGTIGGATVMNAGADGVELGRMVREVTLLNGETRMTWDNAQCGFAYRSSAIPTNALITKVELELGTDDPEQLRTSYDERLMARKTAHPYELPNAGSVFKNPAGQAAWKLIDAVGLRGEQRGGAQISPKHANFIVNHGTARATDILALIDLAREKVAAEFGIELELEVKVVGEDA